MRVAISTLATQTSGLADAIEAVLVVLRGELELSPVGLEVLDALGDALLRCRESASSVLHAFPPERHDAIVGDDVVI